MRYLFALIFIFIVASVMAGTIKLGGDKTVFFKFQTSTVVTGDWILDDGTWDDSGVWDDSATWDDGV